MSELTVPPVPWTPDRGSPSGTEDAPYPTVNCPTLVTEIPADDTGEVCYPSRVGRVTVDAHSRSGGTVCRAGEGLRRSPVLWSDRRKKSDGDRVRVRNHSPSGVRRPPPTILYKRLSWVGRCIHLQKVQVYSSSTALGSRLKCEGKRSWKTFSTTVVSVGVRPDVERHRQHGTGRGVPTVSRGVGTLTSR